MKRMGKKWSLSLGLLAAFVLWTAVIANVDVRAIGPEGSSVGLAGLNELVRDVIGVNLALYTITDWLSVIPIAIALGFGALGFAQWMKRKRLLSVDYSILVLGGFYMAVAAVYLLFEKLEINYRPVLLNGRLEASYPSSTTVLVLCIIATAVMQANERIKNRRLKKGIEFAAFVFCALMLIGRLLSGVHWLTDIIGGALLSAGLVAMYDSVVLIKSKR